MTNPELEDKTVGIIREVEAYRSALARRRSRRPSHSYDSLTWRNYACQLGNRRVEIRGVEMSRVLLVHVPAIGRSMLIDPKRVTQHSYLTAPNRERALLLLMHVAGVRSGLSPTCEVCVGSMRAQRRHSV